MFSLEDVNGDIISDVNWTRPLFLSKTTSANGPKILHGCQFFTSRTTQSPCVLSHQFATPCFVALRTDVRARGTPLTVVDECTEWLQGAEGRGVEGASGPHQCSRNEVDHHHHPQRYPFPSESLTNRQNRHLLVLGGIQQRNCFILMMLTF